ncbi:MAG: porin family protein [Gammaproteobacteria bacterium]|nr:porin family protein [Gammaproteobacteria bacterium]
MTRMAMVALLVLTSGPALADAEPSRWQLGAAAAFSDFSGDIAGAEFEDSAVGAKLYVQYRFNDWLALEGAYHNTGDLEQYSATEASEFDLSLDGYSLQGLLFLPWQAAGLQPFVKAGFFDFDDELADDGTTIDTSSEVGAVAGAGVVMAIADRFGIRAEAEWFNTDVGDLWAVNLGLEYRFGDGRR